MSMETKFRSAVAEHYCRRLSLYTADTIPAAVHHHARACGLQCVLRIYCVVRDGHY